MTKRRNSGQRRVHLVGANGATLGNCHEAVWASHSDDPDASGAVCRRCQKALEKLTGGGCHVLATHCKEHGYVHGAEAEELRAGVERLLEGERGSFAYELQELLDNVDARDSLAFLDARAKRQRKAR